MSWPVTGVVLVVEPVDGRLGADGLSRWLQNALGRSPCDGTAYGFTNRRRTRLKLLLWDGTGVWLCQRRLHRGHFIWPAPGATEMVVDEAQWQWLTAGVDWQRLRAKPAEHWSV